MEEGEGLGLHPEGQAEPGEEGLRVPLEEEVAGKPLLGPGEAHPLAEEEAGQVGLLPLPEDPAHLKEEGPLGPVQVQVLLQHPDQAGEEVGPEGRLFRGQGVEEEEAGGSRRKRRASSGSMKL